MWLSVHEKKGKQQAKWASSVPQVGPKDPRRGGRSSLGSLGAVLERMAGTIATIGAQPAKKPPCFRTLLMRSDLL